MPDTSSTSARDAWHVLMGEFWGWVSGQALLRVARHADKVQDIVTIYRVREVITAGYDAGWNSDDEHGGKIVPRRNRAVAEAVIALAKERSGS